MEECYLMVLFQNIRGGMLINGTVPKYTWRNANLWYCSHIHGGMLIEGTVQYIRGITLINGIFPTWHLPGWVLFQHISYVVGSQWMVPLQDMHLVMLINGSVPTYVHLKGRRQSRASLVRKINLRTEFWNQGLPNTKPKTQYLNMTLCH